ncbi:membrane bound O-acyl transferase family-domain-containing protein [Apodospora peruviana]|uniref:Membrane bound O-acyl transferase family-domain-containing protein n=1 Tax=Apodospora peruviana TaxID=516989 RepID=A0AAE0HZQ4_9PEZI|nr:membrane bound O-acyl transferase family-domain-containing protein [Apodospora peruviana]
MTSWFPPLSLALTSQSLTALAFAYTKTDSILRLPVSVCVAALTWQFHHTLPDVLANRLLMTLLTTPMWIQCIKTFDDLCITRISFEKEKKRSPNQGLQTNSRISWALAMLWNARGIGTPWQIDRLPPWSYHQPSGWIPSRRRELLRHARNFVICYFVLDVFASQPPPDLEGMMAVDNQALFSRLCIMSAEEVIFRFAAVFGFWLNTFCSITILNSIFSLAYLTVFLRPVEMVPPIFGKLSDAYTLRQFWGSTWHQTLRRPLTSISNFIAHSVLHISRKSLETRYIKLFISFGISGAIHHLADLVLGLPSHESQAFVYFVTTAAAIAFEDGVQYISPKVIGVEAHEAWRKYVGYLWVCGYMYWMTPAWAYPAARVVRPAVDVLIPARWSVVGSFVK